VGPTGPVTSTPAPAPHCDSAKVQNWVKGHVGDATTVAKSLGISGTTGEADILALSAVESYWGNWTTDPSKYSGFPGAWFGMHGPLKGEAQCAPIGNSKECVAEFSSFLAAGMAFANTKGQLVYGVTDPTTFFSTLQTKGKFGWTSTDPVKSYVSVTTKVEASIETCMKILGY
jgi:hypothetical protein